MHQYGTPQGKIDVVPWGSVFDAYTSPSAEQIHATAQKYGLPSTFFFYPAITWPHKNHEVILRALAILKTERGVTPHVFFTGSSAGHRSILDRLAQDLRVGNQLHFLGFVSSTELQGIFRSATAMLFPSKFEGFGLPILEAFHAQLPVLSSDATTLPEVARDGARYFDPDSPEELSALMWEILEQPRLRQDLIEKGTFVLSQFSIKNTATKLQALYARIAESSSGNHRLTPVSAAS